MILIKIIYMIQVNDLIFILSCLTLGYGTAGSHLLLLKAELEGFQIIDLAIVFHGWIHYLSVMASCRISRKVYFIKKSE